MRLHFFHSIILTTLLVSSAACAPKTQSISLRCNGEALEVREQNDLPLSHALNSYKFARVSYNGSPLHLEITTEGFSYGNADWDISPHSYGIEGMKKGNKLNFEINRPGYIVVRFSKDQDFTKRLLILVEEAEELPDGELVDIVRDYQVDNTGARNETDKIQQALNDISGSAKVLFFPGGDYKCFGLSLRSHSHIHLSKDARIIADASSPDRYIARDECGINRFIYVNEVKDVHVSGLGTLDGNGSTILCANEPGEVKKLNGMRLLLIRSSSNIHFEGIILKDAARWNTHIVGSEDVSFRHCKLLNSAINNEFLGSLDGWDPDASKRVLIEDCFGWAGDDNVAIKCTGLGGLDSCNNVEDITVRGNVFLTRKTSLKIGTETRCASMKNILFEDNDIIEADRVFGVNVRDRALVENVLFRNNRSEYSFPDRRQMAMNIYITHREDEQPWTGKIRNVRFENCSFEQAFPNKIQISRLASFTEKEDLQVSFSKLTIAGKSISELDPDYFELAKCNGDIRFMDDEAKSPNIVFILTDDQGWTHTSHRADPKIPESKSDYYETPHLDELAASGIIFSQGYAPNPICSPSRNSIMFGQNAARHIYNQDLNWYRQTSDWLTIPKILKLANPLYQAAHFGKWHIAMHPGDAGFDHHDGMTSNSEGELFGDSYLNARDYTESADAYLRQHHVENPTLAKSAGKPSAYWSDVNPKDINGITHRARNFMDSCLFQGRPFYVQLSHFATHLSLVSEEETYDYFRSKPAGARHTNPEFAAMLKDLDSGIGFILDYLKKRGLENTTYVFIMGDNGGRLSLNQLAIIDEEGQLKEARYSTQHQRNLPLRDGKHSFYEGGIRVPFIVSGPGIRAGRTSETPVTGLDLLPTFAALAGFSGSLPEQIDGGNMLPLLLDEQVKNVERNKDYLIFHQAAHRKPRSAIRKGDFKLVKYWSAETKYENTPKVELFKLGEDLAESRNIAGDYPELTLELEAELLRYLDEVHAETGKIDIEGPFFRLRDELEMDN